MPTTPPAPTMTAAPYAPYASALLTVTTGVSTDHLSIEVSDDNFASGVWRHVRGYEGPPAGTTAASSTTIIYDTEAPRGGLVYYRSIAYHNEGGGVFTPSAPSAVVSMTLPIEGSWVNDPTSNDPTGLYGPQRVTIEGSELHYASPVPGDIHWALGRADPVVTQDSIFPLLKDLPPGALNRFPTIQVPFFFKTADAWNTFLLKVAYPVRPVLVRTCFGGYSSLFEARYADQFYGRVINMEAIPLSTANAAKVFRRANVDFQTVRRPRPN